MKRALDDKQEPPRNVVAPEQRVYFSVLSADLRTYLELFLAQSVEYKAYMCAAALDALVPPSDAANKCRACIAHMPISLMNARTLCHTALRLVRVGQLTKADQEAWQHISIILQSAADILGIVCEYYRQ